MFMISYAQNFEDVMLRRVFRDRKTGFYIDVGAADPVIDSVTKFFYDEGWWGINIEPNPTLYEKLVTDRPRDVNLNIALGEAEERKELHVFDHIGNSTFIESNRDHYAALGHESHPVSVTINTLKAICEQYAHGRIDFLKIDCEGWEGPVLRSGDWERFRPTLLVIEATEPGKPTPAWHSWEPFLLGEAHYQMVYFDGLNRFYLANEAMELRSCFDIPPNVFDDFQPYMLEHTKELNRTLTRERDELAGRLAEIDAHYRARVTELEAQQARDQQQIADLRTQKQELEEQLSKTRQWVGRLSQELAATKIGRKSDRI